MQTFAQAALLKSAMILSLFALMILSSGCEVLAPFVKVNGNIQTSTSINGQTKTTQVSFDKLEDMPAAFSQATDQISNTTSQLAKELAKNVEAPPLGQVKLSDLSPRLQRFEESQVDFLHQAAQASDQSKRFQYVQIGVPVYDQFFKVTTEIYAITFQGKQAIVRGKQIAFSMMDRTYDSNTALALILQEALDSKTPPGRESLRGQLDESKEVLLLLADLGPAFFNKSQELVGTGQQLITAAPTTITDPRTILHMDLIVQGLEESLAATTESGTLLGGMITELSALPGA